MIYIYSTLNDLFLLSFKDAIIFESNKHIILVFLFPYANLKPLSYSLLPVGREDTARFITWDRVEINFSTPGSY